MPSPIHAHKAFCFTITWLAMGVMVLMRQYLGEKEEDRVGQVVGGAIFLFMLQGLAQSFIVRSSSRISTTHRSLSGIRM